MAKRDARNLRIADDTSKKRCLNCKFFIRDENSFGPEKGVIYAHCRKWHFLAQGYLVCASWAKGYEKIHGNENVNLIRDYELAKGSGAAGKRKYAVPFYPNPKDKDYKNKFITRYFVRQITNINAPIIEINKNLFESYGDDNGLDGSYYNVISLKWKIAGPEKNILSKEGYIIEKSILNANDDTLKLKERDMKGIRQRLGNLLEFSNRINKEGGSRQGGGAPTTGGSSY